MNSSRHLRSLVSCLLLLALAQAVRANPLYIASSNTDGSGASVSVSGSTPVSITTSGPGYGFGGGSWTGIGSAGPGQLALSLDGSTTPTIYNTATVITEAFATAYFSDAGGAASIAVSLNAILAGLTTGTGPWQSDIGFGLGIGGAYFTGALRSNPDGLIHAVGLLASETDQNFNDLLITTPTVMVGTGAPVTIELRLATTGILGSYSSANIHSEYILSLLTGGPVFNLGAGANVQITDWGVVDNRFGSTSTSVPDGSVPTWLLLSPMLLGCLIRRTTLTASTA